MTTDDFLEQLRVDWTSASVDVERLRLATARRRRRATLRLAADVAGAAIAVIAALWFVMLAIETRDALFWFGAAALLMVPAVVATSWMRAWRDARADYGATMAGVLEQARAQARVELRLALGGRYTVVILLVCAALAWVLQPFSTRSWQATAGLSALWAAIAFLTWLGLRRRVRLLRSELESYERHVQELGREES